MNLLTGKQLKLYYGDLQIFSDVDIDVAKDSRIGIVGPNGSGKTSLIKIMLGELTPDEGLIDTSPSLSIGYVPQTTSTKTNGSLKDEIMLAFEELIELENQLSESAMAIQKTSDKDRLSAENKYSSLLRKYELIGGYNYQNRMERVVAGLGLHSHILDNDASTASGGERTRASLASALLSDPDILVLDEPTNYLDFKGLEWLEDFLIHFSRAFVVVSHDRYFLDRVVTQVWDVNGGTVDVYRGNYSQYSVRKTETLNQSRKEFDRQQAYIAKEEAFIDKYRAGQRSRQAKSRKNQLDRIDRIEKPTKETTIHINRQSVIRSSQIVIGINELSVGLLNDAKSIELLRLPQLSIERGAHTAIIGANGTGKTTLLQTILGLTPSLSGVTTLGSNIKTGYYSQDRHELSREGTVIDALIESKNVGIANARSYLATFLFKGDDVFKLVSDLSGGEMSRLALARLLITEPNLLILDEPTTHLDIPSREALEQALQAYDGTILFVSHDRHLISLLAKELWVIEDATVKLFPGRFEDWLLTKDSPNNHMQRSNSQTPRKKNRRSVKRIGTNKVVDYEKSISSLEYTLEKLEDQITKASKGQNIEEIQRLGKKYSETQSQLEMEWLAWTKENE